MIKTMCLLGLSLTLLGCSKTKNRTFDGEIVNHQEEVYNFTEIQYKGHTYILYHSFAGDASASGLCHAQTCRCYEPE